MLILGIDTATRVGSVGLIRADLEPSSARHAEPGRVTEGCVHVSEVARVTGVAHAGEILSLIDECLVAGNAALEDVACIAVSAGPGTFTGLRVALATAKGLALAGDLPIIGVPTLEALAATVVAEWTAEGNDPAPSASLVACCLDARKGELYSATFALREPVWQDANPRLQRLSPDAARSPAAVADVLRQAADDNAGLVLLGDGPERYRIEIVDPLGERVQVMPFAQFHPRGAIVARLGAGMLSATGAHDLATLVPSYARASEAEVMRDRRRAE